MKELKNYVCTIEQATKLKELGIEKNSLFYWYFDKIVKVIDFDKFNEMANKIDFEVIVFDLHKFNLHKTVAGCLIPAFTSQELGELIKQCIDISGFSNGIFSTKFKENNSYKNGWFEFYINDNLNTDIHIKNEAQARAEFLIYLLQQQKLENKNENETN